jgi:beta-carotene ketolase (CrtW type)
MEKGASKLSNQTTLLPGLNNLNSAIAKQNSIDTISVQYGLVIALLIICLWVVSQIVLLSLGVQHIAVWLIPVAVLWQAFLFTGLFITAHDSMHGGVFPGNRRINTWVGTVAVSCYGLFSYQELLHKHWQHHRYPATDADPDFHDGSHSHPIAWYFHFMQNYWDWYKFFGFSILYFSLRFIFKVHDMSLVLLWILPLILSSIQLFYFGTFLTHKEPPEGYINHHRARTNPLPTFWSFITCYHFGYHEEHHKYPQVPWWQLPVVHRLEDALSEQKS